MGIFWDFRVIWVGGWMECLGNSFGFPWDFGVIFLGILRDFFGNMEGIHLFVKILVFVKILSQWRRRKEGQEIRSLEVRRKLIALKKYIGI